MSSSEPIYSDRLVDTCSECSSALFRPEPDERLKQNFVFCANGHVWLNWRPGRASSSSHNAEKSAGDKPGGTWADMAKKVKRSKR